jgi:HPt (histidine-containing phosphotransfer) domain-containing protein
VASLVFQAWEDRLAGLRGYLVDGDGRGVSKLAHLIRGGALSLSAFPVAEIAEELEEVGKQGRWDKTAALMDRLEEAVRNLQGDYQKALEREEMVQ